MTVEFDTDGQGTIAMSEVRSAMSVQSQQPRHKVDGGYPAASMRASAPTVTEPSPARFELQRSGTTATRLFGGVVHRDSFTGSEPTISSFVFEPGETQTEVSITAPDDGVVTTERVLRVWIYGGGTDHYGYRAGEPATAEVQVIDRIYGGNINGSVYIVGEA